MKKIIPAFFFFTILTATKSSAQDNPLFRHIPPDASTVFQINIPVITGKISWQEIISAIPLSPKANAGQSASDFLKDPTMAGIDIGRDLFMADTRGSSPDSAIYTTWIIHLADSGKFIRFLRNNEPGLHTVIFPDKKVKVRAVAKTGISAAWNKELAVIVIVGKGIRDPKFTANAVLARRSMAALAGYDQSFYTSDPAFKAGFADDADIHIWGEQGGGLAMLTRKFYTPGRSSQNPGAPAIAAQPKGKTLSSLRFDAGKITYQSLLLLTPGTEAEYARFGSRTLNTDLLAHIPKGNLLGFISFNLNPPAIGDLMNKYGTRSKVDSMLAKKHLSLDLITNAFKGDLLLAALEPVQGTEPGQKPKLPVYLVLPVNDPAAFGKVAAAFKEMQDAVKPDSSGQKPGLLGKMKTAYGLKNNILVLSTHQENVDAYLNNTEQRNTDFITPEMKENPINLLIDFKVLADFVRGMAGQLSGKDKKAVDILNALDKMLISGGSMKEGKVKVHFELQLADQQQNSLKTLVQLMH